MAKETAKNRRTNYFIKKDYQRNFIARYVALIVLEAFFISVFLMFITYGTLTTTYHGTHLEIGNTWAVFSWRFLIIVIIVGLSITLAGWMTFLFGSHKIAGPLYRFENSLAEIEKGNLSFRVKLRQKDQLEKLEPHINALINSLDEKMSLIKKDVQEAEKILSAGGGLDSEAQTRLKKVLSGLRSTSDFFHTSK